MTQITEIQVDKDTLPEPAISDLAREVLAKRYLIKDETGEPVETPKDMFWRVASFVASAEYIFDPNADPEDVSELAHSFYYMMSQGYWLPNTPTLVNAGRPLGQLAACFVLPVEDSLSNGKDGIYDTLTSMAKIHKSGGGTGFSFSRLRPSGSMVKTTTGVASGPVSFMSLYDASTDVVRQGGVRRGANMGILRVDHPDVLTFIDCKQDTSKIRNFNISVAVTDAFMSAVERGEDYDLLWQGEVVGQLNAGEVWDKICQNAHVTGEPGLFFIDEANYWNPVPHLGSYEATNPCAEQPLLSYDVCNLGSINLNKFVEDESSFDMADEGEGELSINWAKFDYIVGLSMRFLDNVIELNNYPLPEIEERAKAIRRVGNGVMGFADMLIRLGEPYGSDRSLLIASILARRFVALCKDHSEALAEERGVFPEWDLSIHGPNETCARDHDGQRIAVQRPQRHCNVTTVAPTGSISIIAGCSGGIEPLYAVAFERNQAGMRVLDVNPQFEADLNDLTNEAGAKAVIDAVVEAGSVDIDAVPVLLKKLYKTSETVKPSKHVAMQGVWQSSICSGISKTINLPREASVQDVRDAFIQAWKLNCKGVTVYRDGSRPDQVLSTTKTGAGNGELGTDGHKTDRRISRRPEILGGRTRKIASPVGEMYVTVNQDDDGRPYEVFVAIGKAGGTAQSFGEAVGRLVSLCLRSGIGVADVYKQLRGISCDRAVGFGNNRVLSGPDAVAIVLADYMDEEVSVEKEEFAGCPECGSALEFSEGCFLCHACGHSGCS